MKESQFQEQVFQNKKEETNKIVEKLTIYKTKINQKSTVNTRGDTQTLFKSGEDSEFISRSPKLILNHFSKMKTYVLNKECKINAQLNRSEKDWAFCIRPKPEINPKSLLSQIYKNLSQKYMTSKDFYNVKIINDIIYNESTHVVSVFKDYLILDDISEFLKRRYASFETKPRLI